MNRLLFGDNLKWLHDRKVFPDGSVDLVYLDPPFNSNANYNVLFKEASGEASQAQFHAFTDTWEWTADVDATYAEFVDNCPNASVVELVEALKKFLKTSPMMAYLAMMASRLVELHRVLKPTGSLYLHCDPTASHYLRLVLDSIFGAKNFVNEIVWQRTSAHNDPSRYGRVHDVLLFYARDDNHFWADQYEPPDESFFEAHDFERDEKGRHYRKRDLTAPGHGSSSGQFEWKGKRPPQGRMWSYTKENMERLEGEGRIVYTKTGMPRLKIYVEDLRGVPLQDVWAKPNLWLNSAAKERLGYQTQKPQALLERIIEASCPKDGIVLDPFCGCGTTVHAAQKLGRQWIGIDITYLAINLIKRRLRDAFGEELQFEELGNPTDIGGARRLAEQDKFQFQHWALSLVGARPLREGDGKGADRGVDGLLYFYEGKDDRAKLIVQVKGGGNVSAKDIRDLLGTVENQKAMGGVLITLEAPTKPMVRESVEAGRYKTKLYRKEYPKIQILTVEGLLNGTERLESPPQANPFAKAEREAMPGKQEEML
jgi:site-specific DNA-methyltransferase (adenine-specific)